MRSIDPSGEPDLWVPGPLPGLNEIISLAKSGRGKGNAYHRAKQEWTDEVAQRAAGLSAKHGWTNEVSEKAERLAKIDGPVYLHLVWVERDRRRNPDNIAAAKKFLLDGLVKAGVLTNDGWGQIAGWADTWTLGESPGVKVWLDPV